MKHIVPPTIENELENYIRVWRAEQRAQHDEFVSNMWTTVIGAMVCFIVGAGVAFFL